MDAYPSGIREDYLSHRNTMTLRFLMIVAIFLFHAGLHFGFLVPLNGYTCVSIFFFLSGFGLEYSLANKEGYMRTFMQKRTFGLLLQYVIVMVYLAAVSGLVYLSADVFFHEAKNALFEYTNWFILEMLVFYTLFYFSAMIGNQRNRIFFLAAATVISMYVMAVGYGTDLYYTSGTTFVLGVVWFRYKDRIDAFLARWYFPLLVLFSVLLFYPQRSDVYAADLVLTSITGILSVLVTCMVLMADLRRRWYVPILAIVAAMAFMYPDWELIWKEEILVEGASMLWLAGVSCILYQLPYLSKVTNGLGAMSLELFLLHYATFGWARDFVGTDDFSDILIVSAAVTLVISYVAYRLVGIVMKRFNSGVDRLTGPERN